MLPRMNAEPVRGPRPDIIVALDVPDRPAMVSAVRRLTGAIRWFKMGLEMFCAEGPEALQPLKELEARIFLDLKLHDIPRTVERAVRSASRHGVDLLTLHACGGRAMLEAAAAAAKDFGPGRPRLLAVTVLTSMDQKDLTDTGVNRSPSDQVRALAELAISCGIDGLVCSPQEVGDLRQRLGPGPLLVTPGIRSASDAAGDQKRTATAGAAVKAGSSYLVVGRPILEAADPKAAALALQKEIDDALT